MNVKRKMKLRATVCIICVIVIYLLFFPIPIRLNRTVQAVKGIVGHGRGATSNCQIGIDGTYYFYLFQPSKYLGQFVISDVDESALDNAKLQVIFASQVNGLTYLTDHGYNTLGVLCASGLMDQLLIGINTTNSNNEVFAPGQPFICAPAASYSDAVSIVGNLVKNDANLSKINW